MISIIISTHKPNLLNKISDNISQTIGVEYEIIPIVNHRKYSLCEAYNLGAQKAKYPFLCFVHEDVIFLKNNWGKRLVSVINSDSSIGLVGVVGTKFMSTYPNAGWGTGPYLKNMYRGKIFLDDNLSYRDFDPRSIKTDIEDVVSLDGLFLFTTKEIYNIVSFDEKLLTGFHGYDTDFSLSIFLNGFRVITDRGLEVIHYSPGNYDKEYASANKKIKKKWKGKLPVASSDLNQNQLLLSYYNILCWAGYLRNMIVRKLNLPIKLK